MTAPASPELNPIEQKWAQAKFLCQERMKNVLDKLYCDMSCVDFMLN